MAILVVCEQRQGELKETSLEAMAAAVSVAGGEKVHALLIGSGIEGLAQAVARGGADEVVIADSPELTCYTYDLYRAVVLKAVGDISPSVVIAGHTSQGMDFFPGLAASAGMPMLSDCVKLSRSGDGIEAARQLYGGKIEVRYALPVPCVLTVRQGAFSSVMAGKEAEVRKMQVDLGSASARTEVTGYETPPKEDVDIEKAKIVVSVGRGIEKKENLPVFEELVSSIDGAVLAASRPVIDNGWLPKGRQVGVSGKTVRPKLYLALGISGAIQHLSGMSGSEFVVAVNRDKDAPIFKVADIGVVEDIFKIVPALVNEMKKR